MKLSVLGFGRGAAGGRMVRGDPLDQERTIGRAIAAGVNYFDTAVHGNGESETNLGRILQRLKPANVAVGTQVRLPRDDFGRIADAVAKSRKLSGTGLWTAVRSYPSGRCRCRRHSRARRRRAVGIDRTSSNRQSAA
jgi:aryl-alcohol dehydrogenase-like predicted oxidoreductase